MKISAILEGGWTSTATQNTIITPATVRSVLPLVRQLIDDFNRWLTQKQYPTIKMGNPIGSTAYYKRDDDSTEYGDIDLQVITPKLPDKNDAQTGRMFNKWLDEFLAETKPNYVMDTAAGSPIFILDQQHIQVDFVWATQGVASWSQYRMTPQRGIKGAVHGSIFASFGEIMHISLQAQGAQIKLKDGDTVPYAKTRNQDSIETITTNIATFGLDIVRWKHSRNPTGELKIPASLKQNPGLDVGDITSAQLIEVIKAVAEAFELNNMYGSGSLADFNNKQEFLHAFLENYSNKMRNQANSSKFDKAETPAAREKAQATKDKLLAGIDFVSELLGFKNM